jgi:phosphatidylinositol alpha-1,6-mannosyltransferase
MSRRPRVLVVTPDFPPARGGIQLLVQRVVRNLQRLDAHVVTIGDGAAAAWDAGDDLSVSRSPRLPSHRSSIIALNGLAVREALRFRPDVVLAAHIVVGPAAALIRRVLRVPYVLYLYGKEVGASPGLSSFALAHADRAIVISRYTRDLALGAGAEPDCLRLVPPGVDLLDPEPEAVAKRERPTILTVARLEDHYKGHDILARALPLVCARVPDAEWVVIGDGTLRRTIERLGRANQVREHIRLLGSVTDEERDWWLDRSHVFTMPSRLPAGRSAGEGFGIVYLEAGLHRLPVVAGNVGGATDAVIDGETGRLVDPTSALAVGDALADLLLDSERAAAMGEAGRVHARSFGWNRVVPQVEDVLMEAVGR